MYRSQRKFVRMIFTPAMNLFLYNLVLTQMGKHLKTDVYREKPPSNCWEYLPFFKVKGPQVGEAMDYPEFPSSMWTLNLYINGLVLIPDIMQRRKFALVLSFVVLWNIFILERILTFQIMLIGLLWQQMETYLYFLPIIGAISFMDSVHVMLIMDAIKLQRDFLAEAARMEPQLELPPVERWAAGDNGSDDDEGGDDNDAGGNDEVGDNPNVNRNGRLIWRWHGR